MKLVFSALLGLNSAAFYPAEYDCDFKEYCVENMDYFNAVECGLDPSEYTEDECLTNGYGQYYGITYNVTNIACVNFNMTMIDEDGAEIDASFNNCQPDSKCDLVFDDGDSWGSTTCPEAPAEEKMGITCSVASYTATSSGTYNYYTAFASHCNGYGGSFERHCSTAYPTCDGWCSGGGCEGTNQPAVAASVGACQEYCTSLGIGCGGIYFHSSYGCGIYDMCVDSADGVNWGAQYYLKQETVCVDDTLASKLVVSASVLLVLAFTI